MSKPFKAIRWTIRQAASEFGCDEKTMSNRLRRESLVPGEDGKFSTRQIVTGMFGDIGTHRLRKMKAEADLAELQKAKVMGTLTDRGTMNFMVRDGLAQGTRNISRLKSLTDVQKEEVFAAIRNVTWENLELEKHASFRPD